MRHFFKLTAGVMVMPLMESLMRQPQLWNEDTLRTTFEGTPHEDADDVLLRFGEADLESLETWDRPAMSKVPGAKRMALDVMGLVGGSRLGRVIVTRLEPGTKILPHPDEGKYAEYYSRYHVVLQGLPGSLFMCGDEMVNMQTGDVWWFNSLIEHSVVNNSVDDRVHMLVDIRVDP